MEGAGEAAEVASPRNMSPSDAQAHRDEESCPQMRQGDNRQAAFEVQTFFARYYRIWR
jgi:hypothetical protein